MTLFNLLSSFDILFYNLNKFITKRFKKAKKKLKKTVIALNNFIDKAVAFYLLTILIVISDFIFKY